ncbi:precorrin-8X methylmutase [Acidipropionibacterium timonense]|uniref:precorrin-8X methylmutase n=1 Tax=Acidipropionibacterium timonense TaxID=2161818 RepID=UPI001030FFC4|nr:precorrin-8X methylmutase [Acidipropionibacterium timonense]
MVNDYVNNGSDIYRESFRIIRAESNLERFPADVERVVVRMVHAAADPAIADSIAFTPGVVASARAALAGGAQILCDSSMTATGIIRSRLPKGVDVVCHIKEPRLAALAAEHGTTKTCAAVDLWASEDRLDGAVVAIGNAPTALFRMLEVCERTGARPAAVVGIPVGFVGAAESKQALVDSPLGLEYITLLGRRGGSAVTVAAVNAIASTDELTNEHR